MSLRKFSLWAFLIIFLVAGGFYSSAVTQTKISPKTADDPRDPLLNQGPKPEAVGDKVMVSTQLASVTEAALKVLQEGGNAVDAAITAAFLQHVNDYHQVSIFGAMSALYYEASSGKYYVISAVSEKPHADVAIGGVVKGLEALAERFGTRPWPSYFEPAIASAEEGVIVTSFMYSQNYNTMIGGALLENKEAREFYMPEGHLVPVGFRWKMPQLASTLRKLASEGAAYFYTGDWGQRFIKECSNRGYQVTKEDMTEYQPKWEEPVEFTYRGHKLYGSAPPDTGGLVVGYNLNILENFDLKSLGHYSQSPDTLEIMARTFARVSSETGGTIKDPLNFQIPAELWLSKDYGKMGAEFVRKTMIHPHVSLSVSKDTRASLSEPPPSPVYSGSGIEELTYLGSNQNVIVDAQGNWISMLHTGHGGAPGVFIDGVRATGSRAQAYTSGPGRRLVLPITSIMIEKNGKPWLAMGTPGTPPQPVTEVLVNVLDFAMHPKDAADAPRFWAFLTRERDLEIESRISEDVRKAMDARGIKIKDLGSYNWRTGSMQIIWRDAETGKLHGVTDPRRLGYAAGF